jgi:hypothetical protein
MDDSEAILDLITTRHGRQRRRLHWRREELVREYEVLHEVVCAAVRADPAGTEVGRDASLTFLRRLLDRALVSSLNAYDHARPGGGLPSGTLESVQTVMTRARDAVTRSRALMAASEAEIATSHRSTPTMDEVRKGADDRSGS